MAQSDQDQRPHRRRTMQHRRADHHRERRQRKSGQHVIAPGMAHQVTARKAPDRHAAPQQHQIMRRGRLVDIADVRLGHEIDEQVGHADFGNQINEDRRYAEHQIAVAQQIPTPGALAIGRTHRRRFGQTGARKHHRQRDQHARHQRIGQLGRQRVAIAIGLRQRLRPGCGGAAPGPRQDQHAAEQGRQPGAGGVERLYQGQAAFGGFRRSKRGDERIGRDLQQRDAARHDKQRCQRYRITGQARRDNHAQRSRRHDQQSDHDRAPIADPFDQQGGRD